MDVPVPAGYAAPDARSESVTLPARPEPLRLKLSVCGRYVYATEGGYIVPPASMSPAPQPPSPTRRQRWRQRSCRPHHHLLPEKWDVEVGTSGSPNFHKSNALKTMRATPESKGTLLAKGTWDYAIVDALTPQPGDIVIPEDALQRVLQHQHRQRVARSL